MRTIKLDIGNYVVGDAVYDNVIRCLPAPVKRVYSRRWESEILVDEPNKRIFMIETEVGRPNESVPGMQAAVDWCIHDRKDMLKGAAKFGSCRLLDYDIYLIAAAEYEGKGPWYQFLGGACLIELSAEDIEVAPGVTFSYVVMPYFDKEKYLTAYEAHNDPNTMLFGDLQMMEKYVYQRTKIDLDFHDYTILSYQEDCDIESLLASVNWFHDGKPTIFANDQEFLDEWDKPHEGFIPSRFPEVLAMIKKVPMWDIDIKMYVDKKFPLNKDMDILRDDLVFAPNSYLHVTVIATFAKKYTGTMQLELRHEASGFYDKMTLVDPPAEYCGSDNALYTGTNGFHLDHVLGKGYKVPTDRKDELTAVLYHNRKEVFRKSFPIRKIVS